MSDALEKLQHELKAAQRALAEAEARCARHDVEHQEAATKEFKEFEETCKKIEHAHQEWDSALDAVKDLVFIHDKDFRILRCNRAYQRCAGIPFEQIIGQPYYDVIPKTHAPLPSCLRAIKEEEVAVGDLIYRSRSCSINDEHGAYLYSVHILEDITERKQAEAELFRLNRVLKTLSECNHAMLRAVDETELIKNICDVITASGGYLLAWIGLARQDENKGMEAVAIAGEGKGYVEALHMTWDDRPGVQWPTGTAVHTGPTQIGHDIKNDPRFELWREEVAKYGYASSIALPLKKDGAAFGSLNIYAAEASAFGDDEVALLEEVADDLAFGIVHLRTSVQRDQAVEGRQHYIERLRTSLEEALQAIASTVEMRDPYTAGHQRRVAHLATAIARELGLPEEQVHGIHLAGIVHDLGKIHVPAEVLSKPGRLDEIEFSFIKTHSQVGYNILKKIQFPWPIAQAVLQHHERLDGSGYPQGLKGDAIILEARILAVADVVEAMSSHRPYRPGLGIEKALAEIERGRGTAYDTDVADACLRIFRERRYQLPN